VKRPDALAQDVRFGWRMLRRAPGVSLFAIVAIALGIGINTMVFSLANAVLFKSLPGPQTEDLVFVGTVNAQRGGDIEGMSWPEFLELRTRLRSVQWLAGAASTAADLNDGGQAEALRGEQITPDALRALGLRTLAGRGFVEADATAGAPAVALISERVWRARYAADPGIVGRTVKLNGIPTTIVGVAEQAPLIDDGYTGVWTPLVPEPRWNDRTWRRLTVFGRLAPGSEKASANAEVAAIAATFAREFPDTNRDVPFVVEHFRGYALPERVSLLFLVMLGAVGFVLLVACANVANLMLARAVGRAREVAVRTAIGASRGRIVRQLLIENLMLSIAGGALGLLIAVWGVGVFDRALVDADRPLWLDFSVDLIVLAYLAVIVVVTTLLFGLAPAWRLSRVDTMAVMKEGSPGTGRRRGRLLMSTLVVAEMTLSVVLLAGAGVMIRSFLNVSRVPLGFEREGLTTFRLNTARVYSSDAQRVSAFEDLVRQLGALPGVEAAAVTTSLPLQNFTRDALIQLDPGSRGQLKEASLVATLGAFDRAIDAAVREGRFLDAADDTTQPTVAVVNETFASRGWPGESAVGKQFRLTFGERPPVWLTVVGVMPDVALRQRQVHRPFFFVPYSLLPETDIGVVVRSRAEPAVLFGEVRRTVRELDPELAILGLDTFDHAFYVSQWPQRVFGALFTTFGAVALLLASVGLYGVTSYAASQRRHEIGVRIALGATARHITWSVGSGALRQVIVALLLGLAGAAALTRLLSAQLVDVSPNDPTTLAGVALVLSTTAIAGCLLPVRRALRVNPVEALRHE
jgi:putative ABC transport system permease protein